MLDQLGVEWGEYRYTERSWVPHMAACSTYLDETGKLPVSGEESSDGLKIGLWLTHQRRLFKKGHLREDRKDNLERLLGKFLEPQRLGGSETLPHTRIRSRKLANNRNGEQVTMELPLGPGSTTPLGHEKTSIPLN